MKRRRRWWISTALILLLLFPTMSTSAEATAEDLYHEQVQASGAEELWAQLPPDTREFLHDLGIDGLDTGGYAAMKPDTLLQTLFSLFAGQAAGVGASCGMILGVVLLGALAEGMRQTVRDTSMADTFHTLCAAAACGAIFLPVAGCVRQVCEAADGVAVFMLSYVPAYAAVVIAGGQPTLAASYSTVLLTGAECVSALTTGVVLPLLTVSLSISAVGSLSSKSRMSTLGGLLCKAAGWLLTAVTGLFTALLSLQSLVAAQSDSFGLRVGKLSVGSFVPVVGGALSEVFGTVTGCLRLLKSTLGMFGVLAAAGLTLPSLCRCIAWTAALALCRMAAEVLEVTPVVSLLTAAQTVMKTLIGVLAACALFMIITTTVVTTAGGSV